MANKKFIVFSLLDCYIVVLLYCWLFTRFYCVAQPFNKETIKAYKTTINFFCIFTKGELLTNFFDTQIAIYTMKMDFAKNKDLYLILACCIWIGFACDDFKALKRLTLISTGETFDLAYNQAQINGEIIDLAQGDSLLNHGHCWDTLPEPVLSQASYSQLGERYTTGTFTSALPELRSNTIYYARAYYVIREDTLYSSQITFQTLPNPNAPFLLSLAAFNISTTQAQVESRFEPLGTLPITRYGHCWSTSPNPDINSQNDDLGANPTANNFVSTLVDLQPDTEYFVRAYSQVEEAGLLTIVYGQVLRFRTARE